MMNAPFSGRLADSGRLLIRLRGGSFRLAAPAGAAAAAHLLAEFLAGLGAEVFEAPGHTLLPLVALAGPAVGLAPAPEPAKKDTAQQHQAEGLAQRDSWQAEQRRHKPVPEGLGGEAGGSDKQRREEEKTEAT